MDPVDRDDEEECREGACHRGSHPAVASDTRDDAPPDAAERGRQEAESDDSQLRKRLELEAVRLQHVEVLVRALEGPATRERPRAVAPERLFLGHLAGRLPQLDAAGRREAREAGLAPGNLRCRVRLGRQAVAKVAHPRDEEGGGDDDRDNGHHPAGPEQCQLGPARQPHGR